MRLKEIFKVAWQIVTSPVIVVEIVLLMLLFGDPEENMLVLDNPEEEYE